MKYTLTYTKLDGTRATKTYEGFFAGMRLSKALEVAKSKQPDHDFQETIDYEIPQWIKDLAPITPEERAAAKWFRNNMPTAAHSHGY